MPPRIPRLAIDSSSVFGVPIPASSRPVCLFCSLAASTRPSKRLRSQPRQLRIQARKLSSAPTAESPPPKSTIESRLELRNALADLKNDAASFVNISRLQLAIRGLEQPVGRESIRIGLLGLADGGNSLKKAKELLRLLVVDPLKTEEEWERILANDQGKPVVIKVGQNAAEEPSYGNRLMQELHVSSPLLNGHNLEILVLEVDPPEEGSVDAVLVPTMEIPTSSTGRYTPVTTPVHKAVIVADGILGAATVLNLSSNIGGDIIGTAVDLQLGTSKERATLPFRTVDIELGTEALKLLRDSIDNAIRYEEGWFASGIPKIQEWIKSGTASTDGMKQPVRNLIESLLQNTSIAIGEEQSRRLSQALKAKVSPHQIQDLGKELSKWAERAHTELRDQLDIAFNGHRWRKLSWWKLFWRVDDVSMISTDILNQRFLPEAEKEIVFLSGQLAESGVMIDDSVPKNWAYKKAVSTEAEAKFGAEPQAPYLGDLVEKQDILAVKMKLRPWPLHIPATRRYLEQETIPALQALAQKLVLQTLSTSSLASAFAGLMYVSSITTGLYESVAVAALGIVWSLRRMQGKWETARKFWEGEVKEEGRKAVRGVEGAVGDVLVSSPPSFEYLELQKAREAVERAENALIANK